LCSNKLNTMSLDDLDDFENLDFASVLLNNFGVEPFSSGTDHIIGSSLPQSISTSGESRSQEDADCSGETCVKGPATTKATREKLRRERLNERFAELSKLLNLEGANVDKLRMLSAAVDELKALREEVTMLKSTNSRLHMANTMTSKMAVSLLKSQNGAYVTEEVDDRAVKRQRSESSEAYAQFNAQQQQHILQHPNALAFNLGQSSHPILILPIHVVLTYFAITLTHPCPKLYLLLQFHFFFFIFFCFNSFLVVNKSAKFSTFVFLLLCSLFGQEFPTILRFYDVIDHHKELYYTADRPCTTIRTATWASRFYITVFKISSPPS